MQLKRWALFCVATLSTLSFTAAAAPYQHIRVSTMHELQQAMGSHRTIHLAPGVYRNTSENPTLTLKGVSNLKLMGSNTETTLLVNDRCHTPLLDFENSKQVRIENLGFARMHRQKDVELDCTPAARSELRGPARPLLKPAKKVQRWQQLAEDIIRRRDQGIELPEYTSAMYTELREQVKQDTIPLEPTLDAWSERKESMRPRLGKGYVKTSTGIFDKKGLSAQAAAIVFDRSENLAIALDHRSEVIFAVEARNNTRRSWTHSEEWLEKNAIVPQSNAPAPNGIYAMGRAIKDNPKRGYSFGSYRILIAGGMPTRREILFHSRDNRLEREIPWNEDVNQSNSRTLGCILLQDPDLQLLAGVLKQTRSPVALVIQGSYSKNLNSPQL